MNLKFPIRILALVCLGVASISNTHAALSSDSFDLPPYSVANVNGQGSVDPFYSAPWATTADNDVLVSATGLSWAGLQTSGGSLVSGMTGPNALARAGRYLTAPWNNATVGTYYISFLASFGVAGVATHHRVIEAWNGTIGNDAQRIIQLGYSEFTGLGTTLSVNVNGIEMDLDTNTQIGPDNGATHLFVLRFDLTAAANGDDVYVYQDPGDLINEGAPNAAILGIDFQMNAFGSMVQFVFPNGPPGTAGYLDELRFGTTYQDVLPVPEPTTLSLIGLGSLGLIMAIRRKRA